MCVWKKSKHLSKWMYLRLYSFLAGYKEKKSQDEGLVCLFLIYALTLDLLRLTVTATAVGERNNNNSKDNDNNYVKQLESLACCMQSLQRGVLHDVAGAREGARAKKKIKTATNLLHTSRQRASSAASPGALEP